MIFSLRLYFIHRVQVTHEHKERKSDIKYSLCGLYCIGYQWYVTQSKAGT
jgi:hypothetical protein